MKREIEREGPAVIVVDSTCDSNDNVLPMSEETPEAGVEIDISIG
jgi:hypothetical protein